MKKKSIVDYRLGKFRTTDILGKTKNSFGFLDKSDSKKIYNLVSDAIFKLKKTENENDKSRLQRFSYLLCEEIKSNLIELLQDPKATKTFKKFLSKKISDELKLESFSDKDIFTENDILEILDKTLEKVKEEGILEKYSNILSKKETEKTLEQFSKELFESNKTKNNIADMFKNTEKNSEQLTKYVQNLVKSTATATKTKEKIERLTSEIEAQQKKKELKTKKSSSPSSQPQTDIPKEPPKDNKSFFGNLFKISSFGITTAMAVKLKGMFDFKKLNKDQKKKLELMWGNAKTRMSFAFHKTGYRMKKKLSSFVESMQTFASKSLRFIKDLLAVSFGGLLKLVTSPFTLLFSGIKKLFWKEEGALKQKITHLLKRIFFSASFMFFLGMIFGLIGKIIMTGYKKYQDLMKELEGKSFDDFYNYFKDSITGYSEKAWGWIRDPQNWKDLGTKIVEKLVEGIEWVDNTYNTSFLSTLERLGNKLSSGWESIKDTIMPAINWISDLWPRLMEIIDFLGRSEIGKKALSIAISVIKFPMDFLTKIIVIGMSFASAAIAYAFVGLFSGWSDDKSAYKLEEEYKKSFGVSISQTHARMSSKIDNLSDISKEEKSDIRNTVTRNIDKRNEASLQISKMLGGEGYNYSIKWWAESLRSYGGNFKRLNPEELKKYFDFSFITENTALQKKFDNLSNTMLENFWSIEDDDISTQANFLTNLTRIRKELLLNQSHFFNRMGPLEYKKFLMDETYTSNLFDLVKNYLGDYKQLFKQDLNINSFLEKLYNLRNTIDLLKPLSGENIPLHLQFGSWGRFRDYFWKVFDKDTRRQTMYLKDAFEKFGVDTNLINFTMYDHFIPRSENGPHYDIQNFFRLFDSSSIPKKTHGSQIPFAPWAHETFSDLPYFFTFYTYDQPSNIDFSLNRELGYVRMLNAIDSPENRDEFETLLNYPDLGNVDWDTIKSVLSNGKKDFSSSGNKLSDTKSEQYLFGLLWDIFEAAEK